MQLRLIENREYRRDRVLGLLVNLVQQAPDEQGHPGRPVQVCPDNTATSAYIAALLELLAGIGALRLDATAHTAEVTSVQGCCFLRLLAVLLENGSAHIADWEACEHAAGAANQAGDDKDRSRFDLLTSLQHQRQMVLAQAS